MAIVKMNKITLAAPQSQREDILNWIQTEESIHIVDLSNTELDLEGVDSFKESNAVSETEMEFNQVKIAYEFLKNHSPKRGGLLSKKEVITKNEFDALGNRIDWKKIYTGCKEVEDGIAANKSEKGKIASLIGQYLVWSGLDVTINQLEAMKKVSFFLGSLNNKYESNLFEDLQNEFKDIYMEKVSERQQDVNILLLCHIDDTNGVSEILKKYGFSRSTLDFSILPAERIKGLEEENIRLEENSKRLDERAKELSESIDDIERIYDFYSVKLEKEQSISKLLKTDETFILQGWVIKDKANDIQSALDEKFKDIYLIIEEPGEDEEYPIALKNNAFAEPFETITALYSLPLRTEIDPTPVIAPFFMFFFGMMMADVGYGLVMAVVGIIALRFVELDSGTKKMVKILLYCSIPTIIFGFLFGSFFGGIIKLTPIWIDPVSESMDVLIWSIVFGMVHLFTGLAVKGYMLIKAGKILDAIFDVVLWYVLIIGLILMFVAGGTLPKILSIVGAVGIVATQGRSNASIVGKFFGGLYGLYGITGYLGDALSYSRLLALGLATGMIGWAFNLMVGMFSGPMLFIAGPLIFAIGHTFNFLIGLLGTFVHTCRLQYLEFFGKFYEGGGKPYMPLKINTKFINIKRVN